MDSACDTCRQARWRQERLANRTVNLQDEVLFHLKVRPRDKPVPVAGASRAQGVGVDLDRIAAIHVAGTKGKGSVCQFAESVLRRHGLKTGTFVVRTRAWRACVAQNYAVATLDRAARTHSAGRAAH